jgi:release factor glutamine methyltransferase
MTIKEALSEGVKKAGRRDAGLFLSHILNLRESDFFLHDEKKISADEREKFFSFLTRRQNGEPTQYILGRWEFFGLEFFTDKRALIPRPETELLVEEALKFLKNSREKKLRVLDVCTGSGCIALAIAYVMKECEIIAADISDDALALAKKNAEKLGLTDRVNFLKSDLLENVYGGFDFIVSNPPYILSGDMAGLSKSVRDFEPHLALDGGADGLDFYRRLIPQCKNALCEGGALFLERHKFNSRLRRN